METERNSVEKLESLITNLSSILDISNGMENLKRKTGLSCSWLKINETLIGFLNKVSICRKFKFLRDSLSPKMVKEGAKEEVWPIE